ncbi:MAG: hypothetical protein NZ959_09120 [Armatimonadetes bacterium]|nr:hypothetical protein [Armatimonadota bacterium]MDW8122779.1 hypothetical protein [Armatimonadota bacterium]
MERVILTIGCLMPILLFSFVPGQGNRKFLIELGWGSPFPHQMVQFADQMERTPFDGCVFELDYRHPDGKTESFSWNCWGSRAYPWDGLAHAVDELRRAPLKRLTHNFLRFDVTPGNVDWFDDFTPILHNARMAARIVHQSHQKVKGIFFDIEQYQFPIFDYRKQKRRGETSWSDYAYQVYQRGRQVMEAFQSECPDVIIFLTFGFCLPVYEAEHLGKRRNALSRIPYGLLAPFLNGMLDQAGEKVLFVDGCELAYPCKERSEFEWRYSLMKNSAMPYVYDPEKYAQHYSFGFGIWMDYDWRGKGWHLNDFSKNHFRPDELEKALTTALEIADRYVWVYTEQPRWWSAEGPQRLPQEYFQAVAKARKAIIGD